jgi:protein-S-isoprenylcysteine O-methyltransferase Ste14
MVLVLGWVAWLAPFLRVDLKQPRADTVDRRARAGIALQSVAYCVLFVNPFWRRNLEWPQFVAVTVLASAGCLLIGSALTSLGRHWRIDAGLHRDHMLIQTGPYRYVRHPIYLSMFFMLLATGIAAAPWPLIAIAVVLFVAGTEIRARIEDSLLATRFGVAFADYRGHVASYFPGIR